ncbi:hypothetical protein LF1_51450 [Rubripirellula obstinata]|uniref:Uncharacterized protein n=1 Tax=Rubripirellula obstinata TaxID=406547 RepID=A0A5B1CNH7_9BACT|nr:hypothetical protein LF1_51450 [Rubripirellula obstinata]
MNDCLSPSGGSAPSGVLPFSFAPCELLMLLLQRSRFGFPFGPSIRLMLDEVMSNRRANSSKPIVALT